MILRKKLLQLSKKANTNFHKSESMPQRHISKGDLYNKTALNEDFEAGRISLAGFLAKKKELGF